MNFSSGSRFSVFFALSTAVAVTAIAGEPEIDFQALTGDVRVNRTLRPYQSLDPREISKAKKLFLARPDIRKLDYYQLLVYFNERFPLGSDYIRRPLSQNDPRYLDPHSFVDFSILDNQYKPKPIGIDNAYKALKRAVTFADEALQKVELATLLFPWYLEAEEEEPGDWELDLQYHFKKVLAKAVENPQKINDLLVVMAGVGRYCGHGNLEGWQLIDRMFPDESFVGVRSPLTLKEKIDSHLDGLRETLFRSTVAFKNDAQTVHTVNAYRNLVSSELGIAPGFVDEHFKAAATYLTREEVIHNFFNGKVSKYRSEDDIFQFEIEEDDVEGDRAHIGYTPDVILKSVYEFLLKHPELCGELREYFDQRLNRSEVRSWSLRHRKNILSVLNLYQGRTIRRSQKAISQMSIESLKPFYINAFYFQERQTQSGRTLFVPTPEAVKFLLVTMGHFEPAH